MINVPYTEDMLAYRKEHFITEVLDHEMLVGEIKISVGLANFRNNITVNREELLKIKEAIEKYLEKS